MKIALALAVAVLSVPLASQAAPGGDDLPAPAQPDRVAAARQALESRDYKRAMSELSLALREQPRNADVHNLLGYTYRMQPQRNLPKSFEHYNTALGIDPNHRATMEYMGQAYLMDNKPQEAERLLTRLEAVCGKACNEYRMLEHAISSFKQSGKAPGSYQ